MKLKFFLMVFAATFLTLSSYACVGGNIHDSCKSECGFPASLQQVDGFDLAINDLAFANITESNELNDADAFNLILEDSKLIERDNTNVIIPFGLFSIIKKGLVELTKTFAPKILSKGTAWLIKTANKLTKFPKSKPTIHIKDMWGKGTGCTKFLSGDCPICYNVSKDLAGKPENLDEMLEEHQNKSKCSKED